MAYTLGEAAKATGKSKATISKAIKSGRISAKKGETGIFSIEPSELHRVYPVTVEYKHEETPLKLQVNTKDDGNIRELQARLDAAQERLTDKETVISDLREDRDRWRQQATALLEDRRPRRFWKKLFGN
jgi:predicted  nucleic acid-binding Zn-ribbon protein